MRWCAAQGLDAPLATADDVGSYFAARRQRVAAVTLLGVRSSLRYYYGWLVCEGVRPDDPCAAIHIDTPSSPAKEPFSDDDLKRLLAACRTARERALVLVLLDTGLRPAELLRMRSEHIDWKRGMVRVLGKRGRDCMTGLGSRSLAALRLSVNGTPGAAWVTVDGSKPVSLETLYFIIRRHGPAGGRRRLPQALPHHVRVPHLNGLRRGLHGDKAPHGPQAGGHDGAVHRLGCDGICAEPAKEVRPGGSAVEG